VVALAPPKAEAKATVPILVIFLLISHHLGSGDANAIIYYQPFKRTENHTV